MIDDFRPEHKPAHHGAQEHDATSVEPESESLGATVSHHGKQPWWKKWRTLSKKQKIITIVIVLVVIIGGGVAYALTSKSTPAKPAPHTSVKPIVKPPTPAPVQPTSDLTGLPISDDSVNAKPMTGVMIENSTDARPQSGLDKAGVVFEAVAEGGITRFLALYQDSAPSYIGPVRSVRPYYIQWGMGFDAAIAHVGGSPEALNDMTSWKVKNLDQFANGSFFQRITSRYAPHNVYTSMVNLNTLESKLGYGKPTFTPLARKAESPSKNPNATSIDFNISGYYYNVHYDYDASTNSYKRSEAGAPHMEVDGDGKQTQITPKVVVGLVMKQGIESDDLHTSYDTIGSGTAYIFQDGTLATGIWHKSSSTAQFTFTDANNVPIQLDPGQTWFTALGSSTYVNYK